MATSDISSTPALRVRWKAAVLAGLVAGAVFLMLEMAMVAMTGDSPWGPPRMMAAIVLGKGVLPPPATFDMMIMVVAMAVHFMLSVLFGLVLAVGVALTRQRPSLGVAVLIGSVLGLMIYVVSFYGFTVLFPWFAMARNLISVVGHIVFGAVLAWVYVKLAWRQPA
jgi:hypothetical protein